MSLALAGCMMATTVPVTAFAAQTTTVASEQAAKADNEVKALKIDKSTLTLTNKVDAGKTQDEVVISVDDSAYTAGTITATTSDKYIADVYEKNDTADTDDKEADMAKGKATFVIKANTAETKQTGTATITFTATKKDGTEIKTECKVTVTDPVYVTGVTIPDVVLDVNDTDNDSYDAVDKMEVAPANTTQAPTFTGWSSDDSSVASVTNGSVEAVGRGTTTITGVYNYGEDNSKTAVVKFKVQVLDKTQTVNVTKKDSTDTATADAKVGDKIELVAKVGTKEESVTWDSSDKSVATVDDKGVVTVLKAGTTRITATASDGIKGYYTVTAPTKGVKANAVKFDKATLTLVQGQGTDAADENTLLNVVSDPADAEITKEATYVDNITVNTQTNANTLPVYLEAVSGLNGTVYAVKVAPNANVGTYEIRAKAHYKNPGETTVTTDDLVCTVTVTAADANRATAVGLSGPAILTTDTTTDIKFDGNSNNEFVPTVQPSTAEMKKLVTYSIDDTSVAKVVGNAKDGYKVVALKEGTCVLTATVGKQTATTVITVKDKTQSPLKAIRLNKTNVALVVNDTADVEIEAQYDGANTWGALNGYTALWTSSNENVVTVKETTVGTAPNTKKVGHLVAKGEGTATITANVGGKTATCTVVVIGSTPVVTGFVDVPANAWYADAVNTAAAKGLMNGTGNNKFEPLKTVQRSQVAAIVWNIEGAPAVTGTTPFTDVAADAWYAQAVTWAYQNKVVSGTSATTFAPNQNITRQDFAVVLYNKAGKPAASADLSKFVDASKINSWAQDAVKWAVSKGIINGNDKNELNPTGTLTRAEAASIIVKYVG